MLLENHVNKLLKLWKKNVMFQHFEINLIDLMLSALSAKGHGPDVSLLMSVRLTVRNICFIIQIFFGWTETPDLTAVRVYNIWRMECCFIVKHVLAFVFIHEQETIPKSNNEIQIMSLIY
jgi:hypothetical protein